MINSMVAENANLKLRLNKGKKKKVINTIISDGEKLISQKIEVARGNVEKVELFEKTLENKRIMEIKESEIGLSKLLLNEKVQTGEILKENIMINVPKKNFVKNESEPDWKNGRTDLKDLRESNYVVTGANLRDLMVLNRRGRRATFKNYREPDWGNAD